MCRINNHKETPEDHLNSFERKPKASNTEPQFYIDKKLEDLKNRLKYYQNSYSNLIVEIYSLPDHVDWGELEVPLYESELMEKLADNDASMFWVEDQIATLQHLKELL